MVSIGQISYPKLSSKADHLQLDICGLDAKEAVVRYQKYKTNIPVILHGDWTKKGASENNIVQRKEAYIEIIQALAPFTSVLGFTLHPTFRKKETMETIFACMDELERKTGVECWIENRSNDKIWLSNPQEIIEASHHHLMTIDIPQLYISCGYQLDILVDTLKKLNWSNIRELHLANVKRDEPRTYVGRRLQDGVLPLDSILKAIPKVPYYTLEILGGVGTFEKEKEVLTNTIDYSKI